jgi:hypothetical protein
MKPLFFAAFVMVLSCALTTATAQSVPGLINYQGQVQNPNGSLPPTADYVLSFRIYDAAQGGALVWGPQVYDGKSDVGHGGTVPLVQGFFNVLLGPFDVAGRQLNSAFANSIRYIEVQLGTNPPIVPRQRLLSAPYAFRASGADSSDNADKLDGLDWSVIFGTNSPSTGKILTSKLPDQQIIGSQISDGAIRSNHIADGAVVAAKLAPRSISGLQIAPNAVGTAEIADGAVTIEKLASRPIGTNVGIGGIAISRTEVDGIYPPPTNNSVARFVTNLVVKIQTIGRPVVLFLVNGDASGTSEIFHTNSPHSSIEVVVHAFRGESPIANQTYRLNLNTIVAEPNRSMGIPASSFRFMDSPPAGSHTYSIRLSDGGTFETIRVTNTRLIAFEL